MRTRSISALEPVKLPEVFLSSEFSRLSVSTKVRSGEWERVARGALTTHIAEEDIYARRRRLVLARILALTRMSTADLWVSHTSAALLWGLPAPVQPGRLHVTQRVRPSTTAARSTGIVRHILHLPDHHLTTCQGIAVTTPARTVIDSARLLPMSQSLAIVDAALNRGVARLEVESVLGDLGSRPGVARAREVLLFTDDGAESPGETATRLVLLRGGLPRPETQIEVPTRLGYFWADLGWRKWRLLLEYDGRPKYADQGPEALIREKRRHDAIVEAGFRLLRVTKEDLRHPDELIRRVLAHAPRGFGPGKCPRAIA